MGFSKIIGKEIDNNGQLAARDSLNPDGSPKGSDVFAGSTFGGDANVAGTNVAGFLKDADPRDFMYGRDPNYVTNTAAAERGVAADTRTQLTGQAASANTTGTQLGQQIGAYGQQVGSTLGGMAQTAFGTGAAMQGRQGPLADYQGANSVYQVAKNDAAQLSSLEAQQGPSAAQAQLQSGLNEAQASNLALARSGHGFGMSASALSQAAAQNAAAGQNAVNASAQLRSNEDAAWRARQAANLQGAAGISAGVAGAQQQQALSQAQLQQQTIAQNDQAQAALMGQGLQAYGQAGQMGLAGLTSGAATTQAGQTLDLQGTQAAMGAYTQGEQMAGINMSAQQQADLAREQGLIQNRGIDAGISVQNQNATNSGWGTALSTAAAIGGTALMMASDIRAKDSVEPLDAGPSGSVGGYGQIDPSGSLRAGSDNAFSVGRDAASKAEAKAGADAALKADARSAAINSMLGSASQGLKSFGANPGSGALDQFSSMGRPQQPFYGMQAPSWGQMQPGQITSDEHSKTAIRALAKENRALKAALRPENGPTMEQLNQAAADQDAYYSRLQYSPAVNSPAPTMSQMNEAAADQDTPSLRIKYPESPPPPSPDMLRKAAAEQDGAPVPYTRVASYTSDEREKRDIHQSAALDMIDAAPGYSYEYKDPARHGYGQKFGPMAQDLLKTPAGASTVERSPDGTLAVNTGRLALAEHAALHSMHRENNQRFEHLKNEIESLKRSHASG